MGAQAHPGGFELHDLQATIALQHPVGRAPHPVALHRVRLPHDIRVQPDDPVFPRHPHRHTKRHLVAIGLVPSQLQLPRRHQRATQYAAEVPARLARMARPAAVPASGDVRPLDLDGVLLDEGGHRRLLLGRGGPG